MNENYEPIRPVTVEPASVKIYFLRIGLAVLLLRLVTTGMQYALLFATARFLPQVYEAWWFNWVLSTAPLYLVGVPVFYFTLPKPASAATGTKRFGAGRFCVACIISLASMLVLNYVGFYFTEIIRIASGDVLGKTDSLNAIVSKSPQWATLIFACICAPIMEELIFRKLLVDRARPFGEWQACLLSGLVFGLFHGNFRQFFYAAALGLIFAYVYIRTNNIFYSIGMHMGLNLLGSVVTPWVLSEEHLDIVQKVASNPAAVTSSELGILLLVSLTILTGFAVVVTGIVLFILRVKKLKFEPSDFRVAGGVNRVIYGNPAMISAIVLMGASFIISLLP